MKKVLQKIWNRLFGRSEYRWRLELKILNLEEMAKHYEGGDSPGYLAEFVFIKNWPKGIIMFCSGKEKEKIIQVHFYLSLIKSEEIINFLFDEYSVKVEEVGRMPYKRFFGIEYLNGVIAF